MAASKSLDPSSNEALRRGLMELIRDQFDGNQSQAAKALGISQGFLSEVINGSRGAGPKLLAGLASYAPALVTEAVGLPPPGEPLLPRTPKPGEHENLQRALELGGDKWGERTLLYGVILAQWWEVDRPFGVWCQMLEDFDLAHRGDRLGALGEPSEPPTTSKIHRKNPRKKTS